jgi:hypothetical protein
MATAKIAEYGRDRQGHWKPGFMTHAELVSELETATGAACYRATAPQPFRPSARVTEVTPCRTSSSPALIPMGTWS